MEKYKLYFKLERDFNDAIEAIIKNNLELHLMSDFKVEIF